MTYKVSSGTLNLYLLLITQDCEMKVGVIGMWDWDGNAESRYLQVSLISFVLVNEQIKLITELQITNIANTVLISIGFFSTWLLKNYKMPKVKTRHAGTVQHEGDAHIYLI